MRCLGAKLLLRRTDDSARVQVMPRDPLTGHSESTGRSKNLYLRLSQARDFRVIFTTMRGYFCCKLASDSPEFHRDYSRVNSLCVHYKFFSIDN